MIEENYSLQLDVELCFALGRTMSELYQLEEDGFLSWEEKMFLYAGIQHKRKFAVEHSVMF